MICACQTRATDMKLMVMTQKTRTSPMLDSLTGRCKTRRSHDMVRVLLVPSSIPETSFPANPARQSRGTGQPASRGIGNQGAMIPGMSSEPYDMENSRGGGVTQSYHCSLRMDGGRIIA